MNISNIIPVYNAAPLLERAVESCLSQSEVKEVILVEDKSTDNSLEICQNLAAQYSKVKLIQHASKDNRGAGASRNLGMKNANYPYIAFLDADDYYLPDRFRKTREVFAQSAEVGAVYETVAIDFNAAQARDNYQRFAGKGDRITIYYEAASERLFETLVAKKGSYIHLNGLTIRREHIPEDVEFDESLKLMQDTDYLWRLSLQVEMLPGEIDHPIAVRYVHDRNRIHNRQNVNYYRSLFAKKWMNKAMQNDWNKNINRALLRRYLDSLQRYWPIWIKGVRLIVKGVYAIYLLLRYPVLIRKLL